MKITDRGSCINNATGVWALRLLLLVCLLLLVWHALYWFDEVNDDAFISFRYARNVAAGNGFVYNPGERVEGYSNFLWVIILSLQTMLGVGDLALAAKISGLLLSCGTVILTSLLFRRLYPRVNLLWSALPAALLASSPFFASWTVRGLEGALLTFLLSASILFHVSGLHRGRRAGMLVTVLAFAAVCLSRPEGILYLLVPVAGLVLDGRREDRGADLTLIFSVAAIFLMFLCWRYYYFGEIHPNTFFAKTTYGLPFFSKPRGWRYVTYFLFRQGPAFEIILFLTAAVCFLARPPVVLLTPLLVALAFSWYVNGDWMDNYRFLVPVLPFLFILVTASLLTLVRLARRFPPLVPVSVLFVGLLLAWLSAGNLRLESDSRYTKVHSNLTMKHRRTWWKAPWTLPDLGFKPLLWDQTRWVLENVPDGCSVAFPDIGFLGYVTDFPLYDTQGLTNRNVSHLFHMRRKKMAVDRELVDDFLAVSPGAVFMRYHRATGDGVNQLERALLASDDFRRGWAPGADFPFMPDIGMRLYLKKNGCQPPGVELVVRRYLDALEWAPRVPHVLAGLRSFYHATGHEAEAELMAARGRERFPHAPSFLRPLPTGDASPPP